MVDSSIRYIHRSSYTPPLEPECIPLESCPIVHTLPRGSHTLEMKMHAHPLPQAAHPACAPIHARVVRHLRKQPHSPKQYTPIHSRALSTSRWTRVISAHSPPMCCRPLARRRRDGAHSSTPHPMLLFRSRSVRHTSIDASPTAAQSWRRRLHLLFNPLLPSASDVSRGRA